MLVQFCVCAAVLQGGSEAIKYLQGFLVNVAHIRLIFFYIGWYHVNGRPHVTCDAFHFGHIMLTKVLG